MLAALPFAGKWAEPSAWASAGGAFAAFCLLCSAIYLLNDLADRQADRAHPDKRLRPLASGRLSVRLALAASGVLLLGGAALTAAVAVPLARHAQPAHWIGLVIWTGGYVFLNVLYSLGLKGRPILDVLMIAFGFVLRAMAGAAAVAAVVSPWLVVCTFMLCLFIALGKRRGEVAVLGESAGQTRRVNRFYSLTNLEHMLAVSAGLSILSYTLYCLSPGTIARAGSAHLIWTIPLVVYGMFRYYCLTLTSGGIDPTTILLRDKVLWLVGLVWVLVVLAVLHWGSQPALRDLLLPPDRARW